jgi:hypothetical protein
MKRPPGNRKLDELVGSVRKSFGVTPGKLEPLVYQIPEKERWARLGFDTPEQTMIRWLDKQLDDRREEIKRLRQLLGKAKQANHNTHQTLKAERKKYRESLEFHRRWVIELGTKLRKLQDK